MKWEASCFGVVCGGVKGTVSPSVDLTDHTVARRLLEEGRAFLLRERGPNHGGYFRVQIYKSGENLIAVEGDWVWEGAGRGYAKLNNYVNRPAAARQQQEEEARRLAEKKTAAERFATKEVIARTVEGFTLGMDMDEAIRHLKSKIQSGTYIILEIGTSGLEQKLPILYDSHAALGATKIAIKQSTLFSTPTAAAVLLGFYRSRLFQIAIAPLVDRNKMRTALTEKYGTPTGEVPSAGAAAAIFVGMKGGDIWHDAKTLLLFYENSPATFLTPKLGSYISLPLFYQDRELHDALLHEAAEVSRQLEEQERKRRSTLPRGY